MSASEAWDSSVLVRQIAQLPADRVVQLRGAAVDDIASTLAETATLPAVVTRPARAARTSTAFVHAVLDDLEAVAIGLFPAWLPDAEHIRVPGGAGLAAVRALAAARAAQSAHFGPFLSDLAASALSGARPAQGRFTPEIRAVGLVRVITEGFHRQGMVLLLDVPAGLSANTEQALAAGGAWLADRGRFGVWLAGIPLATVDWLASAVLASPPPRPIVAPRSPEGPGVVGAPHPRSATEAALDAALAPHSWAQGRMWNQSYRSNALRNPVRLDLLWPAERCVVEIDGPEHCEPARFEADRRRDVQLQLDGYAVLRFTNARVRHDVEAVVDQIGKFIQARRREFLEGTAR